MTREEVKALLPIMQAWVDGKDIELRGRDDEEDPWEDVGNNQAFGELEYYEYRIKPEYEYRPFKDAEECWNEMQKHQPFGWIAKGAKLYAIKTIECNTVFIDDGCENRSLGAYFNDGFTFADGTPFGIKKE